MCVLVILDCLYLLLDGVHLVCFGVVKKRLLIIGRGLFRLYMVAVVMQLIVMVCAGWNF